MQKMNILREHCHAISVSCEMLNNQENDRNSLFTWDCVTAQTKQSSSFTDGKDGNVFHF